MFKTSTKWHPSVVLALAGLLALCCNTADAADTWLPSFDANQHVYVDPQLTNDALNPVKFDSDIEQKVQNLASKHNLSVYIVVTEQGDDLSGEPKRWAPGMLHTDLWSKWSGQYGFSERDVLLVLVVRSSSDPTLCSVAARSGTRLQTYGVTRARYFQPNGPVLAAKAKHMPHDPQGCVLAIVENVNDDVDAYKAKAAQSSPTRSTSSSSSNSSSDSSGAFGFLLMLVVGIGLVLLVLWSIGGFGGPPSNSSHSGYGSGSGGGLVGPSARTQPPAPTTPPASGSTPPTAGTPTTPPSSSNGGSNTAGIVGGAIIGGALGGLAAGGLLEPEPSPKRKPEGSSSETGSSSTDSTPYTPPAASCSSSPAASCSSSSGSSCSSSSCGGGGGCGGGGCGGGG